MSRRTSVALLVGCCLGAGCARQPSPGRVEPIPAGVAHDQTSSQAAARVSGPDVRAAVDMDWAPWITGPISVVHRHSGDAGRPGPFRYHFLHEPRTSFAPRRYSIDVHVTVRAGSEFILMGDLRSARVQRFDAGTSFVIPAGTWHVEWFETRTLVEMEGVGPRGVEWASPATPREP